MSYQNLLVRVGALSGALSVVLGAFGAHGLQNRPGMDAKMLANWNTAAQYQFYHSLALVALGILNPLEKRRIHTAGGLFLTGIAIFSGSLYTLVLTQNRKLGAITPIGGLAFIGGWIALAAL